MNLTWVRRAVLLIGTAIARLASLADTLMSPARDLKSPHLKARDVNLSGGAASRARTR